MTNTLAYSGTESITAIKSYIVQALRLTENLKMEFKKLFFPDLRNFKKLKHSFNGWPRLGRRSSFWSIGHCVKIPNDVIPIRDWRQNPECKIPDLFNHVIIPKYKGDFTTKYYVLNLIGSIS
jgi:hypothetical protein